MRQKVLLSFAVTAAIAGHCVAMEGAHCTNASLHGKFVFTARGTTLPTLGLPAPETGAFASSGSAEFDGHGHFTLTATSSFAGLIAPASTVAGTYGVNSDCSYTSQAANGATFRAVIVNDGRELLIMQTNRGTAITGTAEATDERRHESDDENLDAINDWGRNRNSCSLRELAGFYGFLADGYAGSPVLPGAPFAPFTGVGVVDLHQDGTFMMMAVRSVDGVVDAAPVPLMGTFHLTGNCTAELTFDVGLHFIANVVSRDEEVFIETDPGTALIVRSKRIR
jgi:hypothetical protein